MLQSQVINVLPRRILASLWATSETRIALSHFAVNKEQPTAPMAISSNFLCNELPIRYTHILRLLSALSPESLQSPIIKNVAHSYLCDICTLLHPSLKQTSPKALSNVLSKLRTSQAVNSIRLRYAFLSSPTPACLNLMDNINTIGIGIHHLLDQHISWVTNKLNHAQTLHPEDITRQAVHDAQAAFSGAYGTAYLPQVEIKTRTKQELVYIPSMLHRIIYESILLCLKAQAMHDQEQERTVRWYRRPFMKSQPMTLSIFGGPTSVGFKLDTAAFIPDKDLLPSIPRDPIGIPTCSSVLSSTSRTSVDRVEPNHALEWASLSGWRTARSLASHWGGNLDIVNVDGLGSTVYLALDRNTQILERYPTFRAPQQDAIPIQTAAAQLDAFLYAISNAQPISTVIPTPLYHHHSVSLTAAVGHA
ncbi:hypothetical protein RMATCC62417_04638 [Rhizopus microsporus]|nr:hypothetical protein RMATCC62417_04638 [Rhizopus microsporus]